MEVRLFQGSNGPCPYLDDQEWLTYAFETPTIESKLYEQLMGNGFRRSGTMIYKNCCPNCSACIPIRTDVGSFQMTKSQKRVLKKNEDVVVKITPVSFDMESFVLYQKFSSDRYQSTVDESSYRTFLLQSPVETKMMRYFLDNNLVGVGWIDVLDRGVSSVYFAFDTAYSKRGLGTFSILKEVELVREMGKEFLYLGFYVEGCPAMSYKKRFSPSSMLINDQWKQTVK